MKLQMFLSAEDFIVQLFKKTNILGLGEGGHHLENAHQFFQKIFASQKIQEMIDIVILEFLNTRYQDILDEYIFGQDIDRIELQKAWRESTQSASLFGESPLYFDLLKQVRDANKHLPQDKKIRILAGDPPIHWKTIKNVEAYHKQIGADRQVFPAELAIKHGIQQGKKVLMLFSEFHLTKIPDKTIVPDYSTITSLVNQIKPDAMKVIGILYSKMLLSDKMFKNLPLYSIFDLFQDDLGNFPASHFFESSLYKDGDESIIFKNSKLKELFDALIYVGSFNHLKWCSIPSSHFEMDALKELNRRRKIFGLSRLEDRSL